MNQPAKIDLQTIRGMFKNTLGETLGMEVIRCEEGLVEMTMPVEPRHHQPLGLLHGGATVALAETVASLGGMVLAMAEGKSIVGLEINANHLRSVKSGKVTAIGTILHRGKTTQIWEIRVSDESQKLIAISRCTLAVITPR